MSSGQVPEKPFGNKVLAEGSNPTVDIVAIHGLNGHREETWTKDNVNWLRHLLPTDIPNARILSWGYDANIHSTSSQKSRQFLNNHTLGLLSDLCLKRRLTKTQTRPIPFIAHSLGGIVVKGALVHSEAARSGANKEHRSIRLSTYGIIFLGTPHQGVDVVPLAKLMLTVASIFVRVNKTLIQYLETDSELLQEQLTRYGPISQDFVTKFAYEIYETPLVPGKTQLIVPHASAVVLGFPGGEALAIPEDHINMVKLASPQNEGYKKVSGHLQILAEEAPEAISARWEEQDRISKAQDNLKEDFSIPFSLSGVPETDLFVGRKNELTEIRKAFLGDGSHRAVVTLQGLGGMGKGQLAVAFMKERRDYYSATLWLNGKNEDTLKQSFAVMANRLHREHSTSALLRTIPELKNIDQVVSIVKQWLSAKGNHQWMLVFDNIDSPKLPGIEDPQSYDIKSYFPEKHQGHILITTRSSTLKIEKVVSVRKMVDRQESISILSSTSGRKSIDQDHSASDLIDRLDGLPLALATAGAYLNQVSTSWEDYLRYYKASWARLQQTSPGLMLNEDRSLYSTWDLSFKHVQSQNKSAAKLLQLWAYFDNQDVWFQLLAAGSSCGPEWFVTIVKDELRFNEAMRLLCDHALVESLGMSGGYGMHTCVHAWAMHVLNAERELSMATLALECVVKSAPDTRPEKEVPECWAKGRRLLPHARKCFESACDPASLGFQDHPKTSSALRSLGVLYEDQGKLLEAEVMYKQAVKGIEKVFGPDSTGTLHILNAIGNVCMNQGKLAEAEAVYQQALECHKRVWGPVIGSKADTLHNLGAIYMRGGKLTEAEALYHQALEERMKTLGPDSAPTLNTIHNLGILYVEQGNMVEAEAIYQQALKGKEKLLGLEHPLTLDTFNYLGILYSSQNRLAEAESMWQQALEGFQKSLGLEHWSTLVVSINLEHLYEDQGNISRAEVMAQQLLEGREKVLGPEHALSLEVAHDLGILYENQGKLVEAEALFQRVLQVKEKTSRAGSEDTSGLICVANNLGNYLRKTRQDSRS